MKTVSIAEKTMMDNIKSKILIALCPGDYTAYERVYNYYRKPIKDFFAAIIKSEEIEIMINREKEKLWEKLTNKMPPKRKYIYCLSRIEELSNHKTATT